MRARSGRHLLVPGRPRERRQRIFTYKTLRAGPISGAAGSAKSAPLSPGQKTGHFPKQMSAPGPLFGGLAVPWKLSNKP